MVKVIDKDLIRISKEAVVLSPKLSKKEYEAAWRRFWRLMKKIGKLWKTKKSALEIIREERD